LDNDGNIFVRSLRGMRHLRALVTAAMLLAVQVLLGMVAAIPIGQSIRISFGYLALSTTGMLLGPVASMINGALADVLGAVIHPIGPYFPGFTLTGLVSGAIYGVMLYDRDLSLKRVLITKLMIDVICNLVLNTLWIDLLYGKAFFVILPARVLKSVLQYPVDVILLYPLLKAARRVYVLHR
jgi:riboflavin transporter